MLGDMDPVFLSKLTGYAIMFGSVLLKLPQIHKLVVNASADGCSESTLLMEVFTLSTAYYYGVVKAYPFETYAENGIGAFESLVCQLLVMYYGRSMRSPARWGILIALAAYSAAFMNGAFNVAAPGFGGVPMSDVFNMLLIPVGVASKVPQILSFYRAKSTGNAAFLSWFMGLCGAVARTFTTYFQMNDPVVLLQYIMSVFLFVVIMVQFLIYPSGGSAKGSRQTVTSGKELPPRVHVGVSMERDHAGDLRMRSERTYSV